MSGPLWLHAALASLMIVIAANCAIRAGLVGFGGRGGSGGRDISQGRDRAQRGGLGSRSRWTLVDVDGLHVLMGVAMAGMLLPQLRVLPEQVWEVVFGLGALWFGWLAIASRRTGSRPSGSLGRLAGSGSTASGGSTARDASLAGGAPLAHVFECLAMIFMLLPAVDDASGRSHSVGQAMAGMSHAGLVTIAPCVALLLALCLVGSVVWTTDALTRTRSVNPAVATAVAATAAGGAGSGGVARPSRAAGTAGAGAIAGGLLEPRVAAFSTIAMALTMGYMLIQMA
ncbi:MAG TPA: DUF5134 domain-containing protein [Streptosporangiaceae bacterium]|nr:DUF5134 domain-containing protein [Streptosporangiaceae bacterium]